MEILWLVSPAIFARFLPKILTLSGLTVGAVVVPQGMAYALLAKLPAEYGLYTSFVGFLLYWAFATSKDITIGVRVLQGPE